jgi:hypothetical protein
MDGINFTAEPCCRSFKQIREFIYYYKVENNWLEQKEFYSLVRYNLLTESESIITKRSFFMHHIVDEQGQKV